MTASSRGRYFCTLRCATLGVFMLRLTTNRNGVGSNIHADIRYDGTVYWIKPTLSYANAKRVADRGAQVANLLCGAREQEIGIEPDSFVGYSKLVDWPNGLSFQDQLEVHQAMAELVTYQEAPKLEVVRFLDITFDGKTPTPYVNGDGLLLFRRSRGRASVPILAIVTAALVVLRIFIRFFAYNDFPVAIEVLIRDRFGLFACDSMLQNNTRVDYRKKFQLVENAHYGISSELPEVEKFCRGTVQ